jgi:cysteine desulfuration protein SufE
LALEPVTVTGSGNARDEQTAIAEEFALFDDWTQRYQYLIELGRKLPPFPEDWRTPEHRLHGCQSMVWLLPEGDASALRLHASSDSAIVSGLIALVLRVYSGRPAAEIVATPPDFIAAIGLGSHLSPTRSKGLAALLARLREFAGRADAGERFVPARPQQT